ncbi:MAG TPA: 50S ribosomal protein L18 [Candidatus Sulfotelmatobacter sp.]|nr:50S ribosomal protein L18 [Candidatus Sulfotelmatobacter sp.]
MSTRLAKKNFNKVQRKRRIRSKIHGTSARPRLSVNFSLNNVSAQLIDDDASKTLAYATTLGDKTAKGSLTEKATFIGKDIALKAKAKKIKTVVLDRNGKLYHGRVKALAEAARAEGLEF